MPHQPRLFVTGATGQLGGLVIDALLEAVPASAIVAGVRDPAKGPAVALRDRGVEVRVADYARPETLAPAPAAVAAAAADKPVGYADMTPDEFRTVATRAGMPEMVVKIVADTDAGVAKGALFDESHTLSRLLGRPTTPFGETIAAFVRTPPAPGEAAGRA